MADLAMLQRLCKSLHDALEAIQYALIVPRNDNYRLVASVEHYLVFLAFEEAYTWFMASEVEQSNPCIVRWEHVAYLDRFSVLRTPCSQT